MHDTTEDHDLGLAHDLKVMEAMVARRRALKWVFGAGTAALVAGCGGDDTSGSCVTVVSGTATPTPTPTATATATPTPTPTPTPTSSGACIADPTETAGPYPAGSTNASSGSTSNALTATGIVRSDIRPSFIGTTTVATGVQLTLTLTLVDVNSACSPLSGDNVFGDNSSAQIAQQTPAFTGSASAGYTATALIGIAR